MAYSARKQQDTPKKFLYFIVLLTSDKLMNLLVVWNISNFKPFSYHDPDLQYFNRLNLIFQFIVEIYLRVIYQIDHQDLKANELPTNLKYFSCSF